MTAVGWANSAQVAAVQAKVDASAYPVATFNDLQNITPSDIEDHGSVMVVSTGFVYPVMTGTDYTPFDWTATGGVRLMPPLARTVNVVAFGATGDGTTDDTAAIQSAIDWATYHRVTSPLGTNNPGSKIYVPGGRYRTTDTLHLGYGVDGFNCVILEGDSSFGGIGTTVFSQIIPDFNDRPCINIQGGRGSCVRDIAGLGVNWAWLRDNYNSITDQSDIENWFDPTVMTLANNTRYSPYAFITIDAYSGAEPTNPYPDVNYPDFLGPQSQYNKNKSSQTTLENVTAGGFFVGVMVAPWNGSGSADFTTIKDCDLSWNVTAYAAGNEDARSMNIFNTRTHFCHTVLDGLTYGGQAGFFSLTWIGSSCDNVYRLMNVEIDGGGTAQGGYSMTFDGLYTEAIRTLGIAHDEASGSSFEPGGISIRNAKIVFTYGTQEYTPAHVIDAPGVNVLLDNVEIYGGYNFTNWNCELDVRKAGVDSVLDMIGTDTQAKRVASSFAPFWAQRAKVNAFLPQRFNAIGGEGFVEFVRGEGFDIPFRVPASPFAFVGMPIPWFVTALQYGDAKFSISGIPPLTLNRGTYSLSSLSKATGHATFKNDYTFTVDDGFVADAFGANVENSFAVGAGDIAIDETTGYAFFVAGITFGSGDITMRLRQLSGLKNSGTTGAPVWEAEGNMSATAGNLVFHNARRTYPTWKRVYAEMTSGAATITGKIVGSEVTTDDDVPANSLFVAITTDDFVISSPLAQGINDSVFPYGKVSTKNSTTGVITMTQNARRNFYGEMPLFVKGNISGTSP